MTVQNTQIPAIYTRAIAKYSEIAKEDLDVAFLHRLSSVEDLEKEIDERNKSFSEYRHKRGAIFDAMQAALVPVQLFGDLAAGGASMAFPPSSLVFGAVTYLMSAAKGVSSSYDAIQDLMGTLKDFTIRLKAYSREQISDDLSEKLSDILVTLVEIFALSTKAIKRGRLLKFTRNILLGNDDAIKAAVGKLDKLTKVEAGLVGAETLTEAKRTGRVVDGMQTTIQSTNVTVQETGMAVNQMTVQVTEVQAMLGNILIAVNDQEEKHGELAKSHQDLVRKILRPSATDSAQDWYDKINKTRVPGTGDWIRDEDVFKSWMNREQPIMFISGNPGAGKSYLSSNIITCLKDLYPQGVQHPSHVSLGYFFFKDDNPNTRSFHQALRDLAYQISKNDPAYEKYLTNVGDYGRISTLESAWRVLFVNFFLTKPSITSSVFIILDAVDEAFEEERLTFLQVAKDIFDAPNSGRLQFAIVGRPHVSDQLLESLEVDVPTIYVTTQKNSGDIDRYIRTSIQKSVILRRVSSALRREIAEKLSAGAEGMFLWVNLMLQELVKKRNESSIRKSLDQAPKGLKEMLRHVLVSFSASLNEEELEFLNELLLWVTCATRPLTLGEVESVLELKSPEGDGMIYLEGALRRQFAAFFNLDRDDGLTTTELQTMILTVDESDDEVETLAEPVDHEDAFEDVENSTDFDSNKPSTTVTFCHASLGDFFRDPMEEKVSAGEDKLAVGVVYNDAKAHVLKTCLRILINTEFAEKAKEAQLMRDYAATNWVQHLHAVQPSETSMEDRQEIASMLARMFGQEKCMEEWAKRRSWVSTSENLKAIQSWWEDSDVVDLLPPEEAEFIRSTHETPGQTFRLLAKFCARKWLIDTDWYAAAPCAMIISYIKCQKGIDWEFIDRFAPTAEEIAEAAEWAEVERTKRWYQRAAIVFRQTGHLDQALVHFQQAIDLDPDFWLAKAGMSITYTMKKEWQKSLDLDIQAEALLQQLLSDDSENKTVSTLDLHSVLDRMGKCYRELGQPEKQYQTHKRALEARPYCDACTFLILRFENSTKRFEETMSYLRELAEDQVPDKGHDRLTDWLWRNSWSEDDFFEFFADAARATDSVKFMIRSYHDAARAARKASMTVVAAHLDLSLARIYFEITDEKEKATKRWEKIMNTYSSAKEEGEIGAAKVIASSNLARLWLCSAIDAGVGSEEAKEYVNRLEQLVERCNTEDTSALWVASRARAIALGVWYRLVGRHDEARALFAPSIRRAVQILSDDDPENDSVGLTDLQNALLAAGDTKNVIAVSYAIGCYPDDDHTQEWTREHIEDDSWYYTCDGPCRKLTLNLDGTSLCPICFDTGFCEDCTKLLRAGDTSFTYIFLTTKQSIEDVPLHALKPPMVFQEDEGLSIITSKELAETHRFHQYTFPCKKISLAVHSSLEAVGLIAGISSKLAEHGISSNVGSGYYHDHIFVPLGKEQAAMAVLEGLMDTPRPAPVG
ncbi:NACHT and TPR domain protein [Aspergillus clavatus NRRL 1]|uniref:NACHT and TPR domain protein n=1 Tax=Aspergillus clavatus (strain ATCC 1007 / CBS 513.65 / DSM 816 / NCTC 3887 / NRRL 1 / QM 1276 / 107) TaxID=344612 RepID=A1CE02_ASPCL|nr:NACHT and TPR domain protein [Aspergillus clavatus NRRL 1]EAW12079.1 NACHT and TPR domain protein [Aspergillus clavatus NRRL 1]